MHRYTKTSVKKTSVKAVRKITADGRYTMMQKFIYLKKLLLNIAAYHKLYNLLTKK